MIAFHNKGPLDLNALRLFGASVKEGTNPIGMFGTGLKYALAVLMRHGATVRVYPGDSRAPRTITHTPVLMREKGFDVVCMDGEQLGFTTELGKGWELWQAYRELYCNALDEGGDAFAVSQARPANVSMGDTLITVEDCPDFDTVHAERNKWFIPKGAKPLFANGSIEVYSGQTDKIFYRGVAAGKLSRPSVLTWNVLMKQDLTEDRTLKYMYTAEAYAVHAVVDSDMEEQLLEQVLLATQGSWEAQFNYDFAGTKLINARCREIIRRLRLNPKLNRSAYVKFRQETTKMEGPAALTRLKAHERKMLERAKKVLMAGGYSITEKIFVTEDLHDSTLGTVFRDQIVLSRRVFAMGTKMVAGTILEEHLHIARGVADETREMQNLLIDMLMSAIEEHVIKEPI